MEKYSVWPLLFISLQLDGSMPQLHRLRWRHQSSVGGERKDLIVPLRCFLSCLTNHNKKYLCLANFNWVSNSPNHPKTPLFLHSAPPQSCQRVSWQHQHYAASPPVVSAAAPPIETTCSAGPCDLHGGSDPRLALISDLVSIRRACQGGCKVFSMR